MRHLGADEDGDQREGRQMTESEARGAVVNAAETSSAPARAGLVLISLVLVAAVANLNLAVANVALPSIGRAFDSSRPR
jgi:DHA2 family multidrug resistance protein-like MFS transporter